MYVCIFVLCLVNRLSQIGSHSSSSLDHSGYPVYEVSLCELSPSCIIVDHVSKQVVF